MIANILLVLNAIHLTDGDERLKRFQMCLVACYDNAGRNIVTVYLALCVYE